MSIAVVAAGSAFALGRVTAGTGGGLTGEPRAGKERGIFRVSVPHGRKVVALSFDDGPSADYTAIVLRILAAHRAHATFFLVGRNALANRDLVSAELAGGHEIGNHTWDHADLARLPPAEVLAEVRRGADAIREAGGPSPVLFRPPSGRTSETVAEATDALGYRTVFWTLTVEHYVDHTTARRGVDQLLARVHPGAIILAHDGGVPNRDRTVAALSLLLDGLATRGYQVVTVGQLLGLG